MFRSMKGFSTRNIGAAFTGDRVVIRHNCFKRSRMKDISTAKRLCPPAQGWPPRLPWECKNKGHFNRKSGCVLQPRVGRFGYPGNARIKDISTAKAVAPSSLG